MNILIIHNAYQFRGGEDAVVEAESELLRSAGHTVYVERISNDDIAGLAAKARAFVDAPYAPARAPWAAALVKRTGAELVHVHNFFPQLSPAVHDGAYRAGAAVVQTLHNFRLICANALLLRDGSVCEKCVSGTRLWAVAHRCYRGSAAGSLAVARMQWRAARHDFWRRRVDCFIALSQAARARFIDAGLPEDAIQVKPNFVLPSPPANKANQRSGALFVGRLAPEKGLRTLLQAWAKLPNLPLRIIGEGPERAELEAIAPSNVVFSGGLAPPDVRRAMNEAQVLVAPSIWPEMFGLTIVEAFASSLPVAASRIGSLPEIVEDNVNGCLFTPGDPESLVERVTSLLNGGRLDEIGAQARATWERRYSPTANLRLLEEVYGFAMARRACRLP